MEKLDYEIYKYYKLLSKVNIPKNLKIKLILILSGLKSNITIEFITYKDFRLIKKISKYYNIFCIKKEKIMIFKKNFYKKYAQTC